MNSENTSSFQFESKSPTSSTEGTVVAPNTPVPAANLPSVNAENAPSLNAPSLNAPSLNAPSLNAPSVNANSTFPAGSPTWKAVGSPARRASVTTLDAEETFKRTRAASLSGNGLFDAPPGLKPGSEGGASPSWTPANSNSTVWNEEEEMRDQFFIKSAEVLTEEEYLAIPKGRSRSKSSSAIFGFDNLSEMGDTLDPIPDISSSIWGSRRDSSSPMHRRTSTQPSQQTLMWEAMRASQLATPDDMNGSNTDELLNRFKQEQQALNLRRFSVAPSMVSRFMTRNVDEAPIMENTPSNSSVLQLPESTMPARRHSVAGPTPYMERKLNTKFLSEGFQALGLDDATKQIEKIDDYFEKTESRTRAFREASKNLQANQDIVSPILRSPEAPVTHTWPIYVVEFKSGRTDYFYLPAELSHIKINVGDLAIVEADRGKDLGKVIETDINSLNELQLYQATHEDPLVDSHNAVGKEIQPKRLFRVAEPNEVALLLQKGQDEAKANALCQSKIRQKKLPMEVVDAEYQWDRRKLTFYFVADRRIDFRELVRELFKIYKTRIWMCAVQPRA